MRDVLVFVLILGIVLAILSLLAYAVITRSIVLGIIAIIIGGLLFLAWTTDMLLRLKEYERAVVFRFGRFVGVRGPGWIFILPYIEDYRIVDLRIQTIDVPKQEVVTKDNIVLMIDAVIYLRVVDPAKAVLNVDDYKKASQLFVQAMIRDLIGSMTLEEVIGNIEKLNEKLKEELAKIAKEWGVEVVSVQIKDIDIPPGIKEAMHEMMIAEKEKQARTQRAQAMKIELEAIKDATKDMNERVLLYFYLEALKKLAEGRATKIIYPLDLSTLARAISQQIGGVVPAEKIESDLKKYEDVLKKVLSSSK
ncbi:MAG: hypothetical protein GXO00_02925 [Candidatus Diapherotrites archaeon]|nr:hypothetical protein [Candidatus Diapherotrites archaeon]